MDTITNSQKWNIRRSFAEKLSKTARENPKIHLLTADLGYGLWDPLKFPKFTNCGASEQAMLDIAVGLYLSGEIPFCYSISPFLVYRAFETIRTYIIKEQMHIILIGSGQNKDYELDGYSHDATDVPVFLRKLGIASIPASDEAVDFAVNYKAPLYIELRR